MSDEEEDQDSQSYSSDEDSMDSWYYESSEYAREQRYYKRQIRKERKNGFKPREQDAILYDEVRRQLETNDPDIERDIYTGRILLWMSKHYWPYDKDWEGAGRAIGNNIHLEEMHIGMTQRTDHEMNYNTKEQFISFWTGVSNNTSIDKLTIWNYNLLGGRKFFTIMKQFIRQLTELHIERADINAKGASALALVLSEENSLANLTIGGGRSRDELGVGFDDPFTAEGWTSFVRCLQSPHCKLTSLTIKETSMDNTTASVLAQGLKCNPHLKEFQLQEGLTYLHGDNRLLTTVGWKSIFSALQTNCGIKQVKLTIKEYNNELEPIVGEDAVIALANALSYNRTLKRLVLMMPPLGWESYLSKVICNESSIMATYESNHILECISGSKAHSKLHSLLQVNKTSSSPSVAARQKIITSHFRDANVKQFLDMDEEVYSHVIAWMAKDKDGLSLLTAFLCGISGCIGDWQKGAKERPIKSPDVEQLPGPVDEEKTIKPTSIDIQGSPETKVPKRFCGRSYVEQHSIIFSESCQRRISSEVMEEQMKKVDGREAAETEG